MGGDGAHRVLNVNVGILGHIDSGKTSIARALSTHFSTASLDKHPQSMARGITLDLGRGLHSSTFLLKLSALYGIGGARRGYVACVKGVFRVCRVFSCVRHGSS